MMVLLLIGLMAFIGAVMLLVSGISTLVSFGFSIILKMVLGLAGIFCGILLILFVIFLVEEMMNL